MINLKVNQGDIWPFRPEWSWENNIFKYILAGTVVKSEGKVTVWGFDLDQNLGQVRAAIGIVPQEVNLDVFSQKTFGASSWVIWLLQNEMITDLILKTVSLEKSKLIHTQEIYQVV